MQTLTAKIAIEQAVLDEMKRILELPKGLEDTRNGDTIQSFTGIFENGWFADIKVCNGSDDSSPWVDCVLFDPNGNDVDFFVSEDYKLEGEYTFRPAGDIIYDVVIEAK